MEEIGRLRAAIGGQGMVVENSPVHSSKSNGFIERTLQSVQGLVRTWRSSLEAKWSVKLDVEHRIWPWLVEMVGWMMLRADVGADGKTAYERCKGRRPRLPGMEFGEAVLWKRRREGGPLGKLSCMWEDGVSLGVKGTTGELVVGDKKGVWRTRTVRRKTVEERWHPKSLELVGGVPWRTDGSEGDGDDLNTDVTIMDKDYREKIRDEAKGVVVPRRMYIKKSDVEEHGYTVRCPGCISILRVTARQEHSDACRRRLEKEMEGTQKAKNAKARMREYVDRKMEEDEQARKRRREMRRRKAKLFCEKTNVEGDETMEETREKRKRGEVEDDDVMKRAKSSSSGQVSAEETMKILRKVEREERKRKRDDGGAQDVDDVEVAGYAVNEEVVDGEVEGAGAEVDGDELDPEQVKMGRKEELEFMIKKLDMFEFGTYEEAVSRGGQAADDDEVG